MRMSPRSRPFVCADGVVEAEQVAQFVDAMQQAAPREAVDGEADAVAAWESDLERGQIDRQLRVGAGVGEGLADCRGQGDGEESVLEGVALEEGTTSIQ